MTLSFENRRVVLLDREFTLADTIRRALDECGILERIRPGTRIALKPNLTYPYHKPGVTTTPEFIRETVRVLSERTDRIAIVETDGGYGAWNATQAFEGHGLYDLQRECPVEVVNLCTEAAEDIEFRSRGRRYRLPLPVRLLHQTDLLISLPVPKIHCMTGLSLAYKNQWGCIPDTMRLRRHHIFNDAILAIDAALKPAVLGDGTWFLDRNGPMDGDPVRMDVVIAATDAGAFDRYVAEYMGWSVRSVPHLHRAVKSGASPARVSEIVCNRAPADARRRRFRLERTARNWIALAGFRSRFLTWFGYESWFGRVVLHAILYGLVGRPVKLRSEEPR